MSEFLLGPEIRKDCPDHAYDWIWPLQSVLPAPGEHNAQTGDLGSQSGLGQLLTFLSEICISALGAVSSL